MDDARERFLASGDAGTVASSEWTEYTYDLRRRSDAARLDDLDNQLGAIPYILAFDPNVGRIDITQPSGHQSFRLRAEKPYQGGGCLVTVEVWQNELEAATIQLAVARQDGISVAIPISSSGGQPKFQPRSHAAVIHLPTLARHNEHRSPRGLS